MSHTLSFLQRWCPPTVLFFCLAYLCVGFCSSVNAQTLSYDDVNYSKGSFFGGSKNDSYLLHMALDADGNIYGTGFCTDIPTTAGCYQASCRGQFDVMVFKMDPSMTKLIWATYIGGSDIDAGGSIAVNAVGEVFIGGYTYSKNFPTTSAADQAYLNTGQVAVFALKLSADGGRLLYSRVLGNGAPIQQQSQTASKQTFVCLNPNNECYVASTVPSGAQYTITNNAFQRNAAGSFDVALTKLDQNGNVMYSTFIGGAGSDVARDLCYSSSRVYLVGLTNSASFPRNATRPPQQNDAFALVVDDLPTPRVRKSYVFGSSGNDAGMGVCVDTRARRLLVCGTAEFSTIGATTLLQSGQSTGGFLASLDTGLTRIHAISMLGTGVSPTSIAVRSNGNVFMAGYVIGSLPVSANAFQKKSAGDMDGLLLQLDSGLSKVRYCSYLGGSNPDYAAAKVLLYERSCMLRIIFGITTHSPNFPSSSDSYQPLKANGTEDQPVMVLFSSMHDLKLESSVQSCAREISLKVVAKCPPLEIVWNFGDGTPDVHSLSSVQHVYAASGVYRIQAKLVYEKPDTILMVRDVVFNGSPGVNAGPDVDVCKLGSTVILKASGALKYRWSPAKQFKDSTQAQQEFTPTVSGTYVVYGTDASGCESSDTVRVRVINLKPSISRDTILCSGQTVRLNASGAASIEWLAAPGLTSIQGTTALVSPLADQRYYVVVREGNCFDTLSVLVRVRRQVHLTMPSVPALCAGQVYNLHPSVYDKYPGDTLSLSAEWTPHQYFDNPYSLSPALSVSKNTTVYFSVKTLNGCVRVDSLVLRVQAAPKLSAIADTMICDGGSLRLWVKGYTKVRWSPTTGLSDPTSLNPLCTTTKTTTYTVIATNGSCSDTANVLVRVGTRPIVKALGDTTVCATDRVCLRVERAEAGVRYLWSPSLDFENAEGSVVYAHPPATRNYTVYAITASGCSALSTVSVRVSNTLSVALRQDSTVCDGEFSSLSIVGGVRPFTQYTWIPSDGQYDSTRGVYFIRAQRSKSYSVVATRGHCTASSSLVCAVKQLPSAVFPNDTVVCVGSAPILRLANVQSGSRVRWSDGTLNAEHIVGSDSSTDLRLRALNSDLTVHVALTLSGCVVSKTIVVHVQQPPVVQSPPDDEICPGTTLRLRVGAPANSEVTWSPSTGLSSTVGAVVDAQPMRTTTYTIRVRDPLGCECKKLLTIRVRAQRTISLSLRSSSVSNDNIRVWVDAESDTLIHTPLRFDLECDADAFAPDTGIVSERKGQRRIIHCQLDNQAIATGKRTVHGVEGLRLLANSEASLIRIVAVEAEPTLCPKISTTPCVLENSSCFFSGRHIEYQSLAKVNVFPSPCTGESTLTISDLDPTKNLVLDWNLIDERGQVLKRMSMPVGGGRKAELKINLSGMPAGVYLLRSTVDGRQLQASIIKQD